MARTEQPLPLDEDPALMVQVLARHLAGRALEDVRDAGVDDIRESDGYVFQHLLPGPLPVGELAARLGITQQGASKAVRDMERRGLVRRTADPADARVRRVELTDRAVVAVAAGRASRRRFAAAVVAELGPTRAAALRRDLRRVLAASGAERAVRDRNVPAPTD